MVGQLLDLLLTDAMTDIEVVARELNLRDGMLELLRRSLDRLACAQSVVEAVCSGFACNEELPMDRVIRTIEALAYAWPQDYCVDAVKWLLLDER